MWNTENPPLDQRVLASVRGKVWIGRHREHWTTKELVWAFEGKTLRETQGWVVDGWQALPEAINPQPIRSRWQPTTYLDAMELSVRSGRLLRENGITSKKAILALTRKDLMAIKGMGVKSADEILECRNSPHGPYVALLPPDA